MIVKACSNCKNAWKRTKFDIKTYGNYQCPYECLAENHLCVRADDHCELWEHKENENHKGE